MRFRSLSHCGSCGKRVSDGRLQLEFKWAADNMQNDGNGIDFYTHGDAAPDGWFSYLYAEEPQLLTQP